MVFGSVDWTDDAIINTLNAQFHAHISLSVLVSASSMTAVALTVAH